MDLCKLQEMNQKDPIIDPKSGFNSQTKTFHSIRPPPVITDDDHLHLPQKHPLLPVSEHALLFRSNSPWRNDDSVAIIDSVSGQRISYSEFICKIESLACYLQKVTRLAQSDVAFVLAPNSTRVPILYFALLSLGVVVSPANPISTKTEISRLIQLSKPVVAFATSSTVHKLPELKHGTILIDSLDFDSVMTSSNLKRELGELQRVAVRQSDVAVILYSSGTTGKFKGVMLTHENVTACLTDAYVYWRQSRQQSSSSSPAVSLLTVPFFHMYGLSYLLRSVATGEVLVVMPGRFELNKMLKTVEVFRINVVALAPPVIVHIVKSGITDGYDLNSLEAVICGGAPLGKDVSVAFSARFPKVLLAQGYGITEAGGALFRTMSPEEARRWGSVGRLLRGFEAKIVDPQSGEALPPCKEGEIWLRGSSIMKGYVGDSEATSATLLSDGWMRTGDIGYIDEGGFLFIVDRLKELIKYNGYQVPPAELEDVLLSHPDIADAAVIPYPDEAAGQVPMAFVVRNPHSTLNEAEVKNFVANQVAPYKKIRHVAFVNSIPKNATGKILRKDLMKVVAIPSFSTSRL